MKISIEGTFPWDKKQKKFGHDPYKVDWVVSDFNECNQALKLIGTYDERLCVPKKDRSDEVSACSVCASFDLPDEIFHQVGTYDNMLEPECPIYEVDINDFIRGCREAGLNVVV